MVAQAFVDDSGGKGTTRHFVLAGLVGDSESWAEFSDEWRACLAEYPNVKVFKMKEAASCSGQFYGMDVPERDKMLLKLARIINRRPRLSTYSMIDLEAHAKTWAHRPKPHSEPYFWPYHNTIAAVCHHLWNIGWRERFEIIYDVDVIFGPRARLWYPVVQKIIQHMFPEQATILPVDPMFKTDDEFLPLQAADMFAWCLRNATDKQDYNAFTFLFEELSNIRTTDYSQYYDLERMQAVMAESERLAKERAVPPHIVELYIETAEIMKRR